MKDASSNHVNLYVLDFDPEANPSLDVSSHPKLAVTWRRHYGAGNTKDKSTQIGYFDPPLTITAELPEGNHPPHSPHFPITSKTPVA